MVTPGIDEYTFSLELELGDEADAWESIYAGTGAFCHPNSQHAAIDFDIPVGLWESVDRKLGRGWRAIRARILVTRTARTAASGCFEVARLYQGIADDGDEDNFFFEWDAPPYDRDSAAIKFTNAHATSDPVVSPTWLTTEVKTIGGSTFRAAFILSEPDDFHDMGTADVLKMLHGYVDWKPLPVQ